MVTNKMKRLLIWLCYIYGYHAVIKLVFKLILYSKNLLLSKLSVVNCSPLTHGEWAIVTGGTDGIGKEFAKGLARRGFNILIISRNEQKLIETCKELSNFDVIADYVVADFSTGRAIYEGIREKVLDKDIGILVNNVGMGPKVPSYFTDIDENHIWDSVQVNICSTLMMTKIALPSMLRKKKGIIMNMSSISGILPVPLLQVYSATKAFIDHFTQSIQWEYRKSGVKFLSLIPSYVSTSLFSETKLNPWLESVTPSSAKYAEQALQMVGCCSRTTAHWPHEIQLAMLECVPSFIGISVLGYLQLSHNSLISK